MYYISLLHYNMYLYTLGQTLVLDIEAYYNGTIRYELSMELRIRKY